MPAFCHQNSPAFVQVKTEAAALNAENSRSFVRILPIIQKVFDKNSFSWRSEEGIDLESFSQCLWKQIFFDYCCWDILHNNNIMQNLEIMNFECATQWLPNPAWTFWG